MRNEWPIKAVHIHVVTAYPLDVASLKAQLQN